MLPTGGHAELCMFKCCAHEHLANLELTRSIPFICGAIFLTWINRTTSAPHFRSTSFSPGSLSPALGAALAFGYIASMLKFPRRGMITSPNTWASGTYSSCHNLTGNAGLSTTTVGLPGTTTSSMELPCFKTCLRLTPSEFP